MNNDTEYFIKNSITGLYFDGFSFCDEWPEVKFDSVAIAWIETVWDNVVVCK